MNARPQVFKQLIATTILLVASLGYAFADDFPGAKPDRRIIKTQQKVDSLFEKGSYERAYFIYRQELAPLGDKYAQYMVGYMTIVGKGTEQDFIAGSAWYRLAAERGDKHFSKARDEILGYFNEQQMVLSDQKYAELRLSFSDAIIVANLIEKDLELVVEQASSSSLGYSPTDAVVINNSQTARRAQEAKDRVATRLEFLEGSITSGEIMSAEEKAQIEMISKRARGVLE